MPFTGSHPAAVLPLIGLRRAGIVIPASALVIGSVVPDVPYFMPFLGVLAESTHTPSAAFGIDLILGLSAFVAWHVLLVPPLTWAAPRELQRRIPDGLRVGLGGRLSSVSDLFWVCLGLILGALTHVVWDAVTHPGRWGLWAPPLLSTQIAGRELSMWLQVVSSVGGLGLMAWYLVRWWTRAPRIGSVEPVTPVLRWGIAVLLVAWAGRAAAQVGRDQIMAPGRVGRQALVTATLIEFLANLVFGVLLAAVVWHLARTGRRDPGPGRDPGPVWAEHDRP